MIKDMIKDKKKKTTAKEQHTSKRNIAISNDEQNR